jgi:CRISPR-associated protein Csh1
MKLSNDIPNKLRHEKIQKYHEATFSAHKHLLDKNIQQWKLNKDESLYYLLSGYGYQTMKKKIEREDENNDQQ